MGTEQPLSKEELLKLLEQFDNEGDVPPKTDPGPVAPDVPKVNPDAPPATREDVLNIGQMLAEYRKELSEFRAELAKRADAPKIYQHVAETPQQRLEARLAALAEHEFYCPGCGFLADYKQKCVGTAEQPHPPIEVVETAELGGDPAHHTAAPAAAPAGIRIPV